MSVCVCEGARRLISCWPSFSSLLLRDRVSLLVISSKKEKEKKKKITGPFH